jgi:hypothetical protein
MRNLGEDKRGGTIMKHIQEATEFGRASEISFRICLPLFGSFGTKKETNSTLLHRTQNNLSGKDYNDTLRKVHEELSGSILGEKISAARMAFIYVQIQNNLRVPSEALQKSHGMMLMFKPKPDKLKFTNPVVVNRTGGWSQEGIDLYYHYFEREMNERKEMKNKFKEEGRQDRCDYFKSLEKHADGSLDSDAEGEGSPEPINFDEESE